MKKIATLINLIKNNRYGIIIAIFNNIVRLHLLDWVSDKNFLRLAYRVNMRRKLDLDNPKTFNEKLQWLKLYDRRPEYIEYVDKFEVKKYIAKEIGEKYVIPTYGVWDRFTDIDFETLPKQFVLKCTHDSGSVVICKDKDEFDVKSAEKKITKGLKRNLFWYGREWPYKKVVPRIIAEKYMEDNVTEELRDYKFFCFNGEVKALFVATDRQKEGEEVKFDFFDINYKHLAMKQGHPNALIYPAKPKNFEEMCMLAGKLSKNIPQLRVDFYEVNGDVYFGELTFSHFGGLMPFNPEKWDAIFGNWIQLPKEM